MIRAAPGSATVLIGMLLSVAVRAGSLPADPWSNPTLMPSRGPAQVIGMPWDGCIAGATRLPWRGAGYEVLRPEEHRTFGDPETVHFVERLGREARAAGLPMFYVGDMAQPRGGPMPAYHVSHQTGVDVDIYLTLQTDPHLSLAARATLEPAIMVKPDQSAIDPTRFGPGQVELLRLAASDPTVNRIFVNPAIKRALCEGYGGAGRGERSWLHRVRPWYGHEAHFSTCASTVRPIRHSAKISRRSRRATTASRPSSPGGRRSSTSPRRRCRHRTFRRRCRRPAPRSCRTNSGGSTGFWKEKPRGRGGSRAA